MLGEQRLVDGARVLAPAVGMEQDAGRLAALERGAHEINASRRRSA